MPNDIYINCASRQSEGRAGLIELILKVFSDEDSNGNNGVEYFVKDGKTLVPFDKLHAKKLNKLSQKLTEKEIVGKAFNNYVEFCEDYFADMSYTFEEDKTGKITALAIACTYN